MAWSPDSWRHFEARQQPDYDDPAALAVIEQRLAALPPLVDPAGIDALRAAIGEAQAGRAFLLQGGDCAESFSASAPDQVASTAGLLTRMARAIERCTGLPVIRVGRIAGQFAKPRTTALERREGIALPTYRGDIVNGLAFERDARRADPKRMLVAYRQAAATLALLRGTGISASHEALLLPWEQALVRTDPVTGRPYASSGHLLWIGDRTRFPGSAHVEFARGIANPLGVKCGPGLDPDTLLRLLDRLDPSLEPGRITLIARMGADRIDVALPPLLRAVAREGRPALWSCDPMHGNTEQTATGIKDRPMARILAETRVFFEIAAAEGAIAGGLHVEMTGEDVHECSGRSETSDGGAYASPCDPRLNPAQAVEVAEFVADTITVPATINA